MFRSISSLQMVVGKFISLNVRGISNFRKRRTIFTWCRKQKADVIFLQETHSTKDNELLWKREWGAPLFCSHGANNSRGVAILIRNNFDCSIEEIVTDADGRYIMLNVLLKGERTILVNIYGPNRDNKLVDFYHSVLKSIKIHNFDTDNIIMGGDFNCPLNPILDKRGGNLMPRQSVINAIESLQWELDLHEIWRIKNPTERSFTWSQPEPLVLSRLDYWLISNSISDNVCDVDIIPSIKTDHSAIKIDFKDVGDGVKGPGLWKLNCSLLRDEVYVDEINHMIPTWIYEGRTDLSDPRSVCENIRSILDIMEYTKDNDKPGILFFIDFEKAFDSLEWDFLNKCLELFNFGPEFIRWVNIFYKNIQSCVINNGLCCDYFNIERGVRQGDPLSPYLFVTAVEILGIAIRNKDSIKGIEINDLETKLLQFADDTTAVLSDLNSANALFSLLKEFEKASGLKLNVKKTEAMWIGSLKSCEDQPLGVSSCGCLSLSDVVIGILKEGMDLVNYVIILGKSYLWNCRHKDIKPSVTFREFLKRNTKLKNILLTNRIELFLSVINGNPMKNCF